MSKRRNEGQLDLDLAGSAMSEKSASTRSEKPAYPQCRVIPFVDANTAQLRREAVRRVAANGIFAPYPSRRGE